MLDLDSLAEKRAQTLNEGADKWQRAVWSAEFQKISSYMSDGEVEVLLASCKSVVQLEAVVAYLFKHPSAATPYAVLNSDAKAAGKSLSEWIAALAGAKA